MRASLEPPNPQSATRESRRRISVVVHAQDPISQEGAIGQLRRHPEVALVDESDAQVGDVAVLLTDSVDETTLTGLRRLVHDAGLRVVLVAGLIRRAELLDVIECGVGAIVWRREATGDRLFQAVLAASRGDGDLPTDLIGQLVSQVGALRPGAVGRPGVPLGLTPRETDVLRLVAEGMGTGEIAVKLAYSERTVKNVIQGLTTRLGLRNRAHAVAYALREGYIS
ncbi:helix-turn-helix transcriptional regulator [Streptomyces milbemycinicus]|uniref:Response regulator transcription factor n=1 Tax=Streptomyces milbemycinicus TaxID=476552 RepID=A0ABW8LCS4_9ACTN